MDVTYCSVEERTQKSEHFLTPNNLPLLWWLLVVFLKPGNTVELLGEFLTIINAWAPLLATSV